MTGVIIRLLPSKGYCFIRGSDRITRFGHARAFKIATDFDQAREGQAVEFDPLVESGPDAKNGGHRAMNIVLLAAGYAVEKL